MCRVERILGVQQWSVPHGGRSAGSVGVDEAGSQQRCLSYVPQVILVHRL